MGLDFIVRSERSQNQKILLSKIGFDTSENESSKVCYKDLQLHDNCTTWIPYNPGFDVRIFAEAVIGCVDAERIAKSSVHRFPQLHERQRTHFVMTTSKRCRTGSVEIDRRYQFSGCPSRTIEIEKSV